MTLQWSQALSAGTGDTGPRPRRAMVAGERDPHTLAALRNDRCQKDGHDMALTLTGTWREEHLFVLQQALARCEFDTANAASAMPRSHTPSRSSSPASSPRLSCTMQNRNRAAQAFHMAIQEVIRSHCACGAF